MTLVKENRGRGKEKSEGEDNTVMLFTFSSDLRTQTEPKRKKQTTPKEAGMSRKMLMRQSNMMKNCFN